jgi:hypothetical protein
LPGRDRAASVVLYLRHESLPLGEPNSEVGVDDVENVTAPGAHRPELNDRLEEQAHRVACLSENG